VSANTLSAAPTVEPKLVDEPPLASSRRHDLSGVVLVAALLATSIIFGLPHLIIPRILGPDRPYTPFAVSGVSSLTYDETSTYAAYVNYTALRNVPPYDTDLFETQKVPVPTSSLPYIVLAALDSALGGLGQAFVVCDFVLPPLALLLLYLLILEITGNRRIALVGSLTTLLVSFGPRNFFNVPALLVWQQGGSIVQPLEYSRLIHPQWSFTLFLAALLPLWRTLRSGGRADAIVAGVLGGLLFYTYFYYFPVWLAACTLLLFARRWLSRRAWVAVGIVNACTWFVSIPFWRTLLDGLGTSNYTTRIARHLSDVGHLPSSEKLLHALAYLVIFGVLATTFLKFQRTSRQKHDVVIFHSAILGAGLAAMNMEVVTGFNLEAILHFANRLFQPFLTLTLFTLGVGSLARARWPWLTGATCTYGIALSLLAIAVARQVSVSINVADKHALASEHRLLFEWLNTNTALDDVVLTSDKDINDLLPVYTHNLVFVPNGERTSASDDEIERRFLVAMQLLRRPPEDVYNLLAQDVRQGVPPLGLTYTYYLFVSGHGSYNLRLSDATLERILTDYRQLDLAGELSQRRVDYVYGRGTETPAAVAGLSHHWLYGNSYGNVWRIERL
jgi:hypothetical protein